MKFTEVKLAPILYNQGMLFDELLEQADPSDDYKGTDLLGTTAYERQLMRFGIKVSGPNSSTFGSFYKNKQSAVLVPWFIELCIKRGINLVVDSAGLVATRMVSKLNKATEFLFDHNADEAVPLLQVKSITPRVLNRFDTILDLSYAELEEMPIHVVQLVFEQLGVTMGHGIINHVIEQLYHIGAETGYENNHRLLFDAQARLSPFRFDSLITKDMELRMVASEKGINVVSPEFIIPYDVIVAFDSSRAILLTEGDRVTFREADVIDKKFDSLVISYFALASRIMRDSVVQYNRSYLK